jgi:hypothetical protein
VPAGFDAWFSRAINVDPAARFQSATELALALNELTLRDAVEPKAPASRRLAFASTQPLESMAGTPAAPAQPAQTPEGPTSTPALAPARTPEALQRAGSTTARGSALSTNTRPRSRRWSLPFGAAAAVLLVIVVGEYLRSSARTPEATVEQSRAALGAAPAETVAPPGAAPSGGALPVSAAVPAAAPAPHEVTPTVAPETKPQVAVVPNPPAAEHAPTQPAAAGQPPSQPPAAAPRAAVSRAASKAAPKKKPSEAKRLDAYDMP